MLTAYFTCLLVGGVFVGLSVFAGGGDHDMDKDVDHDMDHDMDHDLDHDHDFDKDVDVDADADSGSPGAADMQALWLPFFSFKFWTFGTCFFGMTGAALTLVQPEMSQFIIAPLALVVGGGAGTTIAWALRKLRTESSDSLVRGSDLVGSVGVVELPFSKGQLGKVQMNLKGAIVEYTATTTHDQALEIGEKVAVISITGARINVIPISAFKDDAYLADPNRLEQIDAVHTLDPAKPKEDTVA